MTESLSLRERMAAALDDCRELGNRGERLSCYVHAKIDFRNVHLDEIDDADAWAHSVELSRRISEALS